eukprot:187642-Prymnesium_polylepis.1
MAPRALGGHAFDVGWKRGTHVRWSAPNSVLSAGVLCAPAAARGHASGRVVCLQAAQPMYP